MTRWITIVGYCDGYLNFDKLERAFGPFEDRHNACAKGALESDRLPHKYGLSGEYEVLELEEP